MKYISIVLVLCVIPCFANFHRSSGLIDIPTAHILPHLGYRIGIDATWQVGSGSYDTRPEENYHLSIGLGNIVEGYFDMYTIGHMNTATIGFCYNFFKTDLVGLAWGVHDISYAKNISELGYGDSRIWYDDQQYYEGEYEKPFELGSAFFVSTFSFSKNMNLTLGLGRGRYVGYGEISKYFNSNFYHEKGGDWGVGFFGGLSFNLMKNTVFMIEGDGRDVNIGLAYTYLPVEFGLALTKLEYLFRDEDYYPRIAASISYVKIKKYPGPGIIAGTVFDDEGNPLVAEVGFSYADIPKTMTERELGSYKFTKIKPGIYEVYAWADGYERQKKKVEAIADKTVFCDFTLRKGLGDIIGKVVEFKTKRPLIAHLTLIETDASTDSDSNGVFEFLNLSPDLYTIKAEALGYDTVSRPAAVFAGQKTMVTIEMKMPRLVITLKGVKFDFDKATIKPESYPILDEAASIITHYPGMLVEIQGHTDWVGTDEYNLILSNARANSVLAYLVAKHMIPSSRLIARGYGESRPTATNETAEGRAQNRRVEFVIME